MMLKRGWSYVVFERQGGPGAFFEKYPRHRQLISLNKRFAGLSSPEFNLRHDWNSLLETETVASMTARTKDRFPDAGVLVTYLHDVALSRTPRGTFATTPGWSESPVFAAEPPRRISPGSAAGFRRSRRMSPPRPSSSECAGAKPPSASAAAAESPATTAAEKIVEELETVGCGTVVHAGGLSKPNRP